MNEALLHAAGRLIGVSLMLFLANSSIPSAMGDEFFVAPGGTPNGDGSMAAPWDLQTALNHPPIVLPGDVIWMRGGIYRKNEQLTRFVSFLSGAPQQPITVRQCLGERAIIDGNIIQQSGQWVNYWGFEIMNTHSNRVTVETGSFPTAFRLGPDGQTVDWAVSGFDLRAPNVKLINLIIHDSIGGGISVTATATNPELYGTLSYHNGWQGCDRGHGHGLYIQSKDPSAALVSDNLFFENYALGIQATGNEGLVDNISFEGNVAFSNSILSRRHQGNILIGPLAGPARNPILIRNYVYDASGSSSDSNIGYQGGSTNAIVADNYFQTGVHFSTRTEGLTLVSNTFLSATQSLDRNEYPDNHFLESVPMTNVVEVHTNKYEPGRATVIIYNWENREALQVDATGLLEIGATFEVRTVQDYRGVPIESGTFDGNLLEMPMRLLPVTKPIGTNAPASTSPIFQVFIIQPLKPSPDPEFFNNAPTISAISEQLTSMNLATVPVSFTVNDADIPAEYLNLSVLSSNPKLVPNKNIQIAGLGMDRVLTILPAPDQTGTAVVTIAVSDGYRYAETTFPVVVLPNEHPSSEDADPLQLSIGLDTEATPVLSIRAGANLEYIVQGSTNLVNWQFVGTISTDCLGTGSFQEHFEAGPVQRYYRVGEDNE